MIEMPASLGSEGVRDYLGTPFFPFETCVGFAGITIESSSLPSDVILAIASFVILYRSWQAGQKQLRQKLSRKSSRITNL